MFDALESLQLPIRWTLGKIQGWYPNLVEMRLFTPKNWSTLALATQIVVGVEVGENNFDVFQYVDPLIGTSEGGKRQLCPAIYHNGIDQSVRSRVSWGDITIR